MATAQNVTSLIDTFRQVFMGVSTFRWKDGDVSTAELASVKWDKELPVLTDGLEFSQDDPTVNDVKVLGESRPWASTSESGSINMAINLPTVSEDIMGWLYTEGATSVTTAEEVTKGGKSGSFSGKGYKLTKKAVEGTVMIVSEDEQYALIVRHIVGYTSFAFSDPTTTPFAVKITATLSGMVSEDNLTNDFDIAFLKFQESAGE